MDTLEMAHALFGNNAATSPNGGQTTTTYGVAVSDSVDGIVQVNLGGETVSEDDDQTIEVETTFFVKEGDEVIVQLVGADGTGKAPCVIGVVGRGDETQTEIESVTNYVWSDAAGLHVSTQERSVQGANVLLDSDSLDIRKGNSNDEADQTVYASFGKEVTIGSRWAGQTVGGGSQVYGTGCAASGSYSHATGWKTRASGSYSHTEGYQTTASGMFSHAEGEQTIAQGNYSHSEGSGGGCEAHYSHSEGFSTLAGSQYQHVQGKGNVPDYNNKYADIVGNGTQYNVTPSNAYNLDWNGNAEFQGEVYVGGCTPNGETPYPVVRYNTGNSKQEYYDKVNSTWAQVPGGGGGGGSWTSLWTNSAPSSDFSAQTVPLDLSGWNLIAILAKTTTTGNTTSVFLAAVGTGSILSVPNLGSTQYFYKRTMDVQTTGVTFSTGYRNTSGTSGASYCIPVAIYGLA